MALNKRLIGLAAATFLVFLIALLPARTVFALFMPDSVQGFGVDGSLWNGSARIINVSGQQLRNTEWDLALSKVLLGQLGGDIKTRWGGGFAEGNASVGLTGAVRLSDAQVGLNATMLSSLGIPDIGGQISLQIGQLVLQDNWPTELTGRGEIRNLSSPLMGSGASDLIGNVAIEFDTATETEADTVTGRITDIGGPLEIRGTLILTPPGNYDLDTRIKARSSAPKALRDNLKFLGTPEADGSHIFKLAGSI